MNIQFVMEQIQGWLPSAILLILGISSIQVFRKFLLNSKNMDITESRWMKKIVLVCIILMFLILTLLSLPISDTMKSQLFNLLGVAFMATITLSSTTLVGNTISGFMLKAIDGIRPGDFLKVGDHTGRVSEQGLLHVEIQTEDRDLTTLPNLYLITTPVTVVRSSGTIISATVSLGYDLPRSKIESLLIKAGERAGLTDPFVQILELGDFSVSYRIAGFLADVRYLISLRSKLRGHVLDVLHENKIEIVSPSFMNQKVYPTEKSFIPKPLKANSTSDHSKSPEDIIFDKADEAESKERIKEMILKNKEDHILLIEALEKDLENEELKNKIMRSDKRKNYLLKLLETKANE